MKKISEERAAAEAEKEKNKPFEAPKKLNLNTSENLAQKNREKNREQLSTRAKSKKAKEIERAEGYFDRLKKKDELKKQEQQKHKKKRFQKHKKEEAKEGHD